MNYADIETFLMLVRTRNITKAANQLYLSQSTVSNRLKSLENELGFTLFIRGKGHSSIELTRKGEDFAPVAERWRALYEETELIRDTSFSKLRIASSESGYFTLIGPFIRRFGERHPDSRFDVHVCDSEQIYELADKGLIHFGFVSYESDRGSLYVEEIDSQELCIIMHAEKPGRELAIDPAVLDPAKEIRFSGGRFSSMESWREKVFQKSKVEAALTINVGLGAVQHLRQPGYWGIVPVRMAHFLSSFASLQIYSIDEQPEPWKVYMVSRKETDPNKQLLFKQFKADLFQYMSEAQDV